MACDNCQEKYFCASHFKRSKDLKVYCKSCWQKIKSDTQNLDKEEVSEEQKLRLPLAFEENPEEI